MHRFAFFIVSIWLIAAPTDGVGPFTTPIDCPLKNYSPCQCTAEKFVDEVFYIASLKIVCDQVPLAKVKAIFSQWTDEINFSSIDLHIAPNETMPILANLFGNATASTVAIKCNGTYNLVVDKNTFPSLKNKVSHFTVDGCDFTKQPNFAFLDGMREIIFLEPKNFLSFPLLPSSVNTLTVKNARGPSENLAQDPNITFPSLAYLDFVSSNLSDVEAEKILEYWAPSSKETLSFLDMSGNNLTRIPKMTSLFPELFSLTLDRNAIKSIDTQLFTVIYSNLIIHLNGNGITHLDSYVSQPILEKMHELSNDTYASFIIDRNPIECDCHLAWLIVHNRHLLSKLEDGRCSNSTYLADLNPTVFRDCPVFTCPIGIDGKFPSPLSCSSYYTCTGGKSVLINCPAGKVFNRSTLKCDFVKNVATCK